MQEELAEISTSEELKVQYKNRFWLQKNPSITYPVLWNITRDFFLSIVIPTRKGVQRSYQFPYKKFKQTGHH
nr:unnamed protein product [Callosobruchus analis]